MTERRINRPADERDSAVTVDYGLLRQGMIDYLGSAEGQRFRADWEKPSASGSIVARLFAVALLVTGVLAVFGLMILLRGYKNGKRRKEIRAASVPASELEPVPVVTIMKGPSGHCLAVGPANPLQPVDLESLAHFAEGCFERYSGELDDNPELTALLRDDGYQFGRRRLLPKDVFEGPQLSLYDVLIEPKHTAFPEDADGVPIIGVFCGLATGPTMRTPKAAGETYFGLNLPLPATVFEAAVVN